MLCSVCRSDEHLRAECPQGQGQTAGLVFQQHETPASHEPAVDIGPLGELLLFAHATPATYTAGVPSEGGYTEQAESLRVDAATHRGRPRISNSEPTWIGMQHITEQYQVLAPHAVPLLPRWDPMVELEQG